IVDILMPGLGGPELIRRLRESSQHASIPIMVLSGYADLTRYRDLPVDSVQLKPFKMSEFLEKVQDLIGPRRYRDLALESPAGTDWTPAGKKLKSPAGAGLRRQRKR